MSETTRANLAGKVVLGLLAVLIVVIAVSLYHQASTPALTMDRMLYEMSDDQIRLALKGWHKADLEALEERWHRFVAKVDGETYKRRWGQIAQLLRDLASR